MSQPPTSTAPLPSTLDRREPVAVDAARRDAAASPPAGGQAVPWHARWARRQLVTRLAGLRHGRLHLVDGDGTVSFGEAAEDGLEVRLTVSDAHFYSRTVFGGSLGAAEAYMDGCWQADDLTGLVRLLLRNRALLEGIDGPWSRLLVPLRRLYHARRANTRRGSRRNIAAHYDLGNDFFRLFLDQTMMYSCALFELPGASLAEASRAKMARIAAKLDLGPDDHLLEIGTGWGGFALYAAREHGCRVTTTTISPAQHAYATERVRDAGLEDRVEVLDKDYRELTGRYDKLVSIEMIEAVGHRFLDTFFRTASGLLAPDGLMVLQAITIADRFYQRALRSVDFIQRYIFPGGFLPSVGALLASVARATNLTAVHLEDIGPHYARTLAEWRRRFTTNLDEVRRLGFSDAAVRMWEYYFCYCEGGFAERSIGDVQLVLAKPESRRPPLLGRLA